MTGRASICLSALLASGVVTGAQPAPAVQAQVDTLFSRYTRSTPGCAVGADVRGEPVIRAAYGMADLERTVPIALDTVFEAGSIAKQFTAAAVLLLARDRKVSLDDPVHKYIPELPDYGTPVTIRQMLHHTAGLRDWGYLVAVAGWPRGTRVLSHAHVLDLLSRQRALNFPPGTRWSYSNSGYTLAATLVSRASGMPFVDYTRTRIFEPLGMASTSWRDDWTRLVKRRAMGYSERQGTFWIDLPIENVYGNGGLLTTIGDLLKWNGNFEKPTIGDAAFVADLQRRAVFTDGRTHEYALGLYVDTYKGIREIDHSGGGLGYVSHLGRYPDQGVSVALLCNTSSANATALAKAVADLFLTGARTAAAPAPAHTLTAEEAGRLVGLYRSLHPVTVATVAYDNPTLGVSGQYGGRLIPMSATRFVAGAGYTYEFDGRGRMRGVDEFGSVIEYERVEPARPSVEDLTAFTGSYFSDEVETMVTIALEGSTLMLRRRPDPPTPLKPVWADAFALGNVWIVFRRDASGRVAGFSISGDRMWDLPFTRQPTPSGPGRP